jgi:hypothetical protein
MHFIRDPDHADPVSRFEVLLSVIDRSNAVPTRENPFVHLDALYHEIVSSIPSAQWPTVKQLLFLTIHDRWFPRSSFRVPEDVESLRGISILFNFSRHTIYACLTKLRSTLKIPDWETAHKERLMFLHASFSDYLKDPSRSGNFHVGNREDVEGRVVLSLLETWNKCSGDDITRGMYGVFANIDVKLFLASVESTWHQYCSKFDDKTPSRAVSEFHAKLFRELVSCLGPVAYRILQEPAGSLVYMELRKVHMAKLCYRFDSRDLAHFVHTFASYR